MEEHQALRDALERLRHGFEESRKQCERNASISVTSSAINFAWDLRAGAWASAVKGVDRELALLPSETSSSEARRENAASVVEQHRCMEIGRMVRQIGNLLLEPQSP